MTIKSFFQMKLLLLCEIVIVNHSYDYRPTPLSPITIIKPYTTSFYGL